MSAPQSSELTSISAVVPIHNEAGVASELVRRIDKTLASLTTQYEIVLVDDGSTDNTLQVLKELQKTYPKLAAIELARNYGQTAALAAGIEHSQYDIIVTLDGDLQHQPEEIPSLVSKLKEGYDIVSGWREIRRDAFFSRRFPSWCANSAVRYLTGITVQDFGSTFKAYRAEALKRLELFGELHRFIPVLAHRYGLRIAEIPINVQPRGQGTSHYTISRTFGVFEDLVFLYFYANYLTRPMRAFGKLFFLFFGAGFLIALMLMLLWLLQVVARVVDHAALLLFSVFLMLIGTQFLVTGVVAELLARVYLQTSKTKIYSVRNIFRT